MDKTFNLEQSHYKELLRIFQKYELNNDEINLLKMFEIEEKNFEGYINNFKTIPFGYFFIMKASNSSLSPIYENDFDNFYYLKKYLEYSHLKVYEILKSKIKFNKKVLEYLENKDYQLEYIKIVRRQNINGSMKGIIKFKLINFDKTISPDIIDKIELISNNITYVINNKNIFYDNDIDITAYEDNLNENINNAIITNNFGGKISVKHIFNIQGSGATRKMLKENIEKLFLIPFCKIFEIFYISFKDKQNYEKLIEENFGKNFDDLIILKPFELQMKTIDELLLFSRPDILGKFEKEFIKEYIGDTLTDKQENYIKDKFESYYKQAILIQKEQNINCIESELNSFARKNLFPQVIPGDNNIKKLFMCKRNCFESENFISQKIEDSYVNKFFIEKIIIEALQKIKSYIRYNLNNLNIEEGKKVLNEKIGELYKQYIIPNIKFILTLILSSIESGDLITFIHNKDWEKIKTYFYGILFGISGENYEMSLFHTIILSLIPFSFGFEKDFEKSYSKKKVEEIHMKNIFYKRKTKNIINSNVSNISNSIEDFFLSFFFKRNKIRAFSKYSESQIIGYKYYNNFLELLNNYSNDFPEDIEISIFENLKEEEKIINNTNKNNSENNFSTIKEMINDFISDEESKKGFLALVRQSYLLGKLRSNIVSIKTFNFQILGR